MLEKTYVPSEIEPRLYDGWEKSGAFACDPASSALPFTIMIPPPNVTGSLHMGHALTFTVQDTLIRWRRMQGRDVLWQPGTDHAGIATQMVVERLLAEQGNVDRRGMGRDAFIERVWQWKAESGGTITRQLRRLGASLDWPRERFTMDEGLSRAVREVFVTLFRQGLIYRDRRLVNWDPKLQTAISDLEVENQEVKGSLWHIRYPVVDAPGRFITVATTRPETMLGDTAVAVHPDDARFRDLVGKFAILPLVGRRIPIVADAYSDPEKGTGAVKITPAHDFNDFEVGRRHDLPMPTILDREGRVTLAEIRDSLAVVGYGAGTPLIRPGIDHGESEKPSQHEIADPVFVESLDRTDRFRARALIVAKLTEIGLLDKTEQYTHQVPHGDRGGVPIEPRLTTQWYANAAVLAKPAIEAVESGRTQFVPKQWENTFFAWMRDIQPWCISRQLWWGHRIPAWYGPDRTVFVAYSEAEAQAEAREKYGHDEPLVQDEDVLDTWFSSGLWPFSTLGWPDRTRELERYYPGDVLVTGFDIIFFWVARMMMQGIHFMGDVPFRTVYIHGLVRDERGQKMSKSKGNVIDPLELIDRFGADALRFTICALTGPGRDVKLGASRVQDYRSFVTKLWNAARFCEMHGIRPDASFAPAQATLPLTRWILDAANRTIEEADAALEAYRFDEYAATCYRFTWGTFCDWFLELAKPVLEGDLPGAAELRAVTAYVLGVLLRLLHPAIPFVTEELWDHFGYGAPCSLIRAAWPAAAPVPDAAAAREELDWVVRLVGAVRSVRMAMNVPTGATVPILLRDAAPETLARAERWIEPIRRLARGSEVKALAGEMPKGAAQAVVDEATVVLPLAGTIDVDTECARLTRERDKAAGEAAKLAKKLENADFVARAPEEVVAENRERLARFEAEVARLGAALRWIG
ncbi:MAG TPA: valine--tRNA ligase [Acetobacteraceae bacterium]|nr:valine--tRNA ligase [Acetobacteraceae bacterium]